MLDEKPIEVEAEVIEGGELSIPDTEKALALDIDAIKQDVAAMNKQVEGVAQLVETYEIEDEALARLDLKEVKAHATSLNKYFEEYETARKSLKRHLTEPYKSIEDVGKSLMAPVVELRDRYKDEKAARENRERALLRRGLEETYRDFAPALLEVVPFERVLEPQWLNKTYGAAKAAEELEEKVAGIAKDWEAFKALDVPFKDEAEAVFFRELSLQAAIEHVEQRKAEQKRIDDLNAEVEANRAAASDVVSRDGRRAESEPVEVYVLALEMTERGKERLKGYMVANDIHGRLAKSGFASAEAAMECMKGVIADGR